jgi:3-oxoacyl-[acyl-carrier protein] reductase
METVIITGATSGIGEACAKLFSDNGKRVILLGRNEEKLKSLSQKLKNSSFYKIDLQDIKDTNNVISKIKSEYQTIDSLINCAGICKKNNIEDISLEEWNSIYHVNVAIPFLLTKEFLPNLKNSTNASIVNVSSIAGRLRSISLGAHYSSTKAALIGLTRHLAAELGPKGIRVNATCPSQTKTPMLDEALETDKQNALAETIPLRRIATAMDQANVIYFLTQKESSYMNGAILDVNGGQL